MSLGLYRPGPGPEAPVVKPIRSQMVTTCETMPGQEVTEVLGMMEGVSEKSFSEIDLGRIDVVGGGALRSLVEEAKARLLAIAAERGVNGVVGFRYELIGRSLEKSVIAYGTAVIFKKV